MRCQVIGGNKNYMHMHIYLLICIINLCVITFRGNGILEDVRWCMSVRQIAMMHVSTLVKVLVKLVCECEKQP